jgi:hypothetical protein
MAASVAVIVGVYAGWQPPPLVFAGLASYAAAWSLGYHRLEVRPVGGRESNGCRLARHHDHVH